MMSAPAGEPIEIAVGGWGGTVVAFFVALAVGPFIPAILKALFGPDHKGLLHSWDEWRDARARRDAKRQQADRDAAVQALQSTIETLEDAVSDHADRVKALQDKLSAAQDAQAEAEAELQRTVQQQQRYIATVTKWARRVILWAEENGHVLPKPDFQPYFAWLDSHERRHFPREPPGE